MTPEQEAGNSGGDALQRAASSGAFDNPLLAFDRAFSEGLVAFFANLVLVTALMPYVSPVVQKSMDVQLMALATACVVLAGLFFLAPGLLKFTRVDAYVLGLGVITLIYINPNLPGGDMETSLRACAPVLMGFPIYFAIRNLYRFMSPRIFLSVVAFYCGVLAFQVLSPGAYTSIFSHFLSEARWAPEEGRGPNGLTPEPSMMGNMALLFVVSLYFFYREYWSAHKGQARFVLFGSLVMLFVTKSATGVILALIVAIAALFCSSASRRLKALVVVGILGFVLVVGNLLGSSGARGAIVLASLAKNPMTALQDYSLATRLTNLFVGIYQLPEAPLGNGDVRMNVGLTNRAFNGSLAAFVWPDDSFRAFLVMVSASRDNASGIGGMVQRMGFLGILVAGAILMLIRGFQGKWVVRVYVLGLYLNASMFMPTLWFVVACCVEVERAALERTALERAAQQGSVPAAAGLEEAASHGA